MDRQKSHSKLKSTAAPVQCWGRCPPFLGTVARQFWGWSPGGRCPHTCSFVLELSPLAGDYAQSLTLVPFCFISRASIDPVLTSTEKHEVQCIQNSQTRFQESWIFSEFHVVNELPRSSPTRAHVAMQFLKLAAHLRVHHIFGRSVLVLHINTRRCDPKCFFWQSLSHS